MALAWFIAPYKRRDSLGEIGRYCAMDDFTATITADGGTWSEIEVLDSSVPAVGGTAGWALVKVRASATTLTTIAGTTNFQRIPNHTNLNDTLGDLTTNQRNAILNKLLTMGYTQTEIDNALPANWQSVTLRQVLNFARTRRFKVRYDAANDRVVCDGSSDPVTALSDVDDAV